MGNKSFDNVELKFKEAQFFLDKLSQTSDFDIARFYFSAFLSASRSITFSLQAVMKRIDGFAKWYQIEQEVLKENPLAKYFVNSRNVCLHQGVNPVTAGMFFPNKNGNKNCTYTFLISGENDYPKGAPETDAVTACKIYFKLLTKLIWDCYQQFGDILDPKERYTTENLAKAKRRIIRQRKYINELDVSEDEKWSYRKFVAGSELGWIFIEQIGTDILRGYSYRIKQDKA